MFGFLKAKKQDDKEIGTDKDGNKVYRCEKTKLLYILTKPAKRYISVSKVKFNSE